jgi:hypothetical protein
MKKFIILIGLIISTNVFSATKITTQGIVLQAECNKPTGFGIAEIQTIDNDVITSTWYRVRSKELCSKTLDHPMFFGGVTKLVALGSDNLTFSKKKVSQLTFDEEGYLIDIGNSNSAIKAYSMKDITSIKRVNAQQAHEWYFASKE